VGDQQVTEEETVGKFGVAGERSDNWERFSSSCVLSNRTLVSTMFPHIRSSLNGQYLNQLQIDHVATIKANFK